MGRFYINSSHDRRNRLRRPTFLPGTICVGLLMLALMGCGGGRSTFLPLPTATHRPGGLAVRACTGPYADVNSGGTPALTLTQATPGLKGTAHRGDIVQVQLPTSVRWGYTTPSGPQPTLASVQDTQRNICFWNFTMSATGTLMLMFSGTPICDSEAACPQLARIITFTVRVS